MSDSQKHHHLTVNSIPHIGLRKFKSVLAVLIGFFMWQFFRLFIPQLEVHPYYIYIYGVLEIRDSSEKTKEMSKRRAKATTIGLFTGLCFLLLCEFLRQQTELLWLRTLIEITLVVLGVLVTLTIAETVGCKTSCGIAAVIFIIVLVAHTTGDVYFYALQRLVQTFLGLFVAWLINVRLFPYSGKQDTPQKE